MVAHAAIPGVMPPSLGEVRIRECRPTVMEGYPTLARLGQWLTQTALLVPVAWLLMAPLFARKFLPFFSRRYTLTNRAIQIQQGLRPTPVQAVPLAQIDAVRLDLKTYNPFFRSATLEILTGEKVVLQLPAVPDPESFRQAILNATTALVPGKASQFLSWSPASAPSGPGPKS